MASFEQLAAGHGDQEVVRDPWAAPSPAAERAARAALKAQVAKLERELSSTVATRFPHIPAPARGAQPAGPHLPTLAELERQRDGLALQVRALERESARRDELERDARVLLERMKADPRRYKFVRLPVADLGERGCGVWEVRPRLGPIGMLAGWWQLKLSSGCPLSGGPRAARGPVPLAKR